MIRSVKGFNDILPCESRRWRRVEDAARDIFDRFGFSEIRTPVVEKMELFKRSVGAVTDIVEKEMYAFPDRKGESLCLRPEGTASVVRAYIQNNLYHEDPVAKLYYMGPMFRYERPQKGRTRQFYQIGAEVLGVDDPLLDAEILYMLSLLFGRMGIGGIELSINSLGCVLCRPSYRESLISYFKKHHSRLCVDCKRRLELNPLRVLDCKNKDCIEASACAPYMKNNLCENCSEHFSEVKAGLELLNVSYTINPKMVRGLDYYTKTAFEITCSRLGSQNAVAAGGRYDRLVKELGGPDTPGFGFAVGLERTVLLLEEDLSAASKIDVYVIPLGSEASRWSLKMVKELREKNLSAELSYGRRSLKSHMRRADKLNVRYVIIIGEDELRKGTCVLKDMKNSVQQEINSGSAASFISETVDKGNGILKGEVS